MQESSANDFDETTDTSALSESSSEPSLGAPPEVERPVLIVISGPRVGEMHRLDEPEVEMGRHPGVDIRIDDAGVSRRHGRLHRSEEGVWIEDLDSSNGTFVNGDEIDGSRRLEDGDKVTLGGSTILKFTFQDPIEEEFQRRMYRASLRDSLTDAYNRDYLHDYLGSEISYADRHGTELSLILFDLDHFKEVNDNHGHVVGDAVLHELASIVRDSIRTEDVFARYGGEEFAVVLRDVGLDGAATLADRLRRNTAAADFEVEGVEISVTLSAGVASYEVTRPDSPEELISAADRALYRAKEAGRDTVRRNTGGG